MGQHLEELKEKRNKLAKEMLDRIDKWDNSADHAAEIIEDNNLLIKKLKDIDKEMKSLDADKLYYDEKYESYMEEILKKNKILLDKVTEDKASILKSLRDTSKSQQVVKSYVSSFEESMFIDKDI